MIFGANDTLRPASPSSVDGQSHSFPASPKFAQARNKVHSAGIVVANRITAQRAIRNGSC